MDHFVEEAGRFPLAAELNDSGHSCVSDHLLNQLSTETWRVMMPYIQCVTRAILKRAKLVIETLRAVSCNGMVMIIQSSIIAAKGDPYEKNIFLKTAN